MAIAVRPADVRIDYQPYGDMVVLQSPVSAGTETGQPLEDLPHAFVWRDQATGSWVLAELFGWHERSLAEWQAILPDDIPLETLADRINIITGSTGRSN